MANLVLSLSPSERAQQSQHEDQRCGNNVSSSLCGLDARTNDEMRAECHLIVKSLSSSRKHNRTVTASLSSGARGKYFRAYHSDHHQITDHQVGTVAGMHLITRKNKSR
jgi:hypothetical protein